MSSHSSIHGNNAVGVTVVDVDMFDFEVSGFHCNGCLDVHLLRVNIGPNLQHVPFNARLSQAQQLVAHCKRALTSSQLSTVVPTAAQKTLQETCDELEQEIEEAIANPENCVPGTCQFANTDPSGPDGSAVYGVAMVGRPGNGPIVGPFHSAEPLQGNEPEFIEWVLAEEGESCSQKCTLGCAEEELNMSSQNDIFQLAERIGIHCTKARTTTFFASPAFFEGKCYYRFSGSTCGSTHSTRQRMCPCKTNLARYKVVDNPTGAYVNAELPGKCPSGFVDITSWSQCQEAAEKLGFTLQTAQTSATRTCVHKDGSAYFTNTFNSFIFTQDRICQRPIYTDHAEHTLKLEEVAVKELKLGAQEIIHVFQNSDGTNDIKGPFAGVFDHSFSTVDGKFGNFQYNSLAALKMGICVLTTGEMTCTPELWQPLSQFFMGQETLASALGSHATPIGCNGDAMNHQHKGIVGIRVEDIEYLKMWRVSMRDFVSDGQRIDDNAQFSCTNRFDGGDVYGLVVGGVNKITSQYTRIKHINSDHGRAVGIAYTGRVPNFDLMHLVKIWGVNGADNAEATIDSTNVNCPFSNEKLVRLKWKEVGSSSCMAYQNHDLCDGPISCN